MEAGGQDIGPSFRRIKREDYQTSLRVDRAKQRPLATRYHKRQLYPALSFFVYPPMIDIHRPTRQ